MPLEQLAPLPKEVKQRNLVIAACRRPPLNSLFVIHDIMGLDKGGLLVALHAYFQSLIQISIWDSWENRMLYRFCGNEWNS
jgi:hypothetical protein